MVRIALVCLAFAAAAALPAAAQAEEPQCSLENIASPEEIKGGWTLKFDPKIVDQKDSAPFPEGAPGNWFVTRTTATIPQCSAYDDMGNYSLRSYMMPKIVSAAKIQICQATADGGSALVPPPPGTKPRPADTQYVIHDKYDMPYAGPCPPAH